MARRPLIGVFIAAVFGALLADNWSVEHVWALLTVVALTFLALAVRARRGVLVATWMSAAALVALSRAATGPPPAQITTCGRVSGSAGYRESRWRARIDGPREGTRVAAVLERELCDGAWQPRIARAAIALWEGPSVVRGDVVELTLAVEPIAAARNRTDADPRVRAVLEGYDVSARVRSAHLVVRRRHGFLGLVDRARAAAARALDERLSRERAAVAKGLVMGDRADLTPLERDAWADAGLAHLLAVSGMHVTMIVVVVLWLARLALGFVPGIAERLSLEVVGASVALPCAVWFCLWSASPASALRATIMGAVGLVGVLLGYRGRALDALCLTGFVMLIASPMVLHDPGFTLSMAAVAALLVAPRPAAKADGGVGAWAARQLRTSIAASVTATLATLPFTASIFGRVSLVAPLTNLVAVPIGATLATPLAIAIVMLAPLVPRLADIGARALDHLLVLLLANVRIGAALPGASLALPRPGTVELVAYGGLLVMLRRRRSWPVALACLGVIVVSTIVRTRPSGELAIDVPYVGQGDGIIVHLPRGETMLIDAGGAITPAGADPGRGVIAPLLRSEGIRDIDLVVVTHPHPDHLGGFAYLADRFAMHALWSNGQDDEQPILRALRDNVRKSGGTVARSGDLPVSVHYGGLDIDIIHPRAESTSYLPELGLNDNSIVLRLRYGVRSMLLTGDIEALAERELVAANMSLAADILKVGHHGSRTSSSELFLDAVSPELAIASCGDHNDFGFPHAEVVERFRARHVPFLTTRDHGEVRLHTDGSIWLMSTHRDQAYVKTANVTATGHRFD